MKGDVLLSIKDLTDLQNNINKSLEAQNVFGTVTPNFQPLWINDITRLNAQNFNSKMYVSIKEYIQKLAAETYQVAMTQLSDVIQLNAGWKPTLDIEAVNFTSEIHNDYNNNTAEGSFQSVFGINNQTNPDVAGQFIVGQFANTDDQIIFAVGLGTAELRKNGLSVSLDGTTTTSRLNLTEEVDGSIESIAATVKYVNAKFYEEQLRAQDVEAHKQPIFSDVTHDSTNLYLEIFHSSCDPEEDVPVPVTTLVLRNSNQQNIMLRGIADPQQDSDAVSRGYLNSEFEKRESATWIIDCGTSVDV